MPQLYLGDQQVNCLLMCALYERFHGIHMCTFALLNQGVHLEGIAVPRKSIPFIQVFK